MHGTNAAFMSRKWCGGHSTGDGGSLEGIEYKEFNDGVVSNKYLRRLSQNIKNLYKLFDQVNIQHVLKKSVYNKR